MGAGRVVDSTGEWSICKFMWGHYVINSCRTMIAEASVICLIGVSMWDD